MPPMLDTLDEYNRAYVPQSNKDELMLKFSPKTYKIDYQPGSEEWFVHSKTVRGMGMGAMEERKEGRKIGWEGKFGGTEGSVAVGVWGKEEVEETERGWVEFMRGKDAVETVEEEFEKGERDDAGAEKANEEKKEGEDEVMNGV